VNRGSDVHPQHFLNFFPDPRVKATQVRTISNYAAFYDKSEWRVGEALASLLALAKAHRMETPSPAPQ